LFAQATRLKLFVSFGRAGGFGFFQQLPSSAEHLQAFNKIVPSFELPCIPHKVSRCISAVPTAWFLPHCSRLVAHLSARRAPLFIAFYLMMDSASITKGAIVQDGPVSPTSSTLETPIDRAAERRLVRKLDLRILPVLWLLYLVNFIDR
jgi:hypothetical protein